MSDDNLNDFSCFDWLTPTDELYSSIGEPPMAPPLLTTVSQAPIINDLNTTTFGPPPVIWLNSFWTRCDGGEERTGVCTRIEPKFTGSTFNLMIGSYAVPDQLSPDTQFKFTTPPFSATLYQDFRVPLYLAVVGGAGYYHVQLVNLSEEEALLEYYRNRTRPLYHTMLAIAPTYSRLLFLDSLYRRTPADEATLVHWSDEHRQQPNDSKQLHLLDH